MIFCAKPRLTFCQMGKDARIGFLPAGIAGQASGRFWKGQETMRKMRLWGDGWGMGEQMPSLPPFLWQKWGAETSIATCRKGKCDTSRWEKWCVDPLPNTPRNGRERQILDSLRLIERGFATKVKWQNVSLDSNIHIDLYGVFLTKMPINKSVNAHKYYSKEYLRPISVKWKKVQ